MPTLVIPNSFTANTVAVSSQVNANFSAISTLLNSTKLDNDNIQTGGIGSASLASGAVTAGKIAVAATDNSTIGLDGSSQLYIKNGGVTLTQLAASLQALLVPTATVLSYAGTSAPTGFLMCDGSAVSRTTYSALFAIIGESCGQGDNVTTFNLPDYRGRFLRGADNGAGNDPDAASRTAMATGGATGDNVGSLQADEVKSHAHAPSAPPFVLAGGSTGVYSPGASGTSDSNSGAYGGNETRPKNASVNFIIKT